MKAAELVETRMNAWRLLEMQCAQLETRSRRRLNAAERAQFASLYRAACADLALADAYQLPSSNVRYLHQLVGRAHNQLYRSGRFAYSTWYRVLAHDVPRQLFHDPYLRVSFLLFWGGFFLSAFLASQWTPIPEYTETVMGGDAMQQMEMDFSQGFDDANSRVAGSLMTSFYTYHNTSIGLRCFAMGLVFGVGGLFAIAFNAVFLGAAFGFMSTTPHSDNFFEFVTAHGPFELTAIVLSGAAGLRLGFSIVDTKGLERSESLARAAKTSLPIMMVAVVLFFLAAIIEGFISPSTLPYEVKASVAMASTMLLLFYFALLGYSDPPEEEPYELPHEMPLLH
jgi:uncharacterized membrane protein SpoIIM required for sporulation